MQTSLSGRYSVCFGFYHPCLFLCFKGLSPFAQTSFLFPPIIFWLFFCLSLRIIYITGFDCKFSLLVSFIWTLACRAALAFYSTDAFYTPPYTYFIYTKFNPRNTWILSLCLGRSFVYCSSASGLGSTKIVQFDQWSLPRLNATSFCSSPDSCFTTFLSLLFWLLFFRASTIHLPITFFLLFSYSGSQSSFSSLHCPILVFVILIFFYSPDCKEKRALPNFTSDIWSVALFILGEPIGCWTSSKAFCWS